GGRDRLFRRPAQLGAESAASSPSALCRPGWRHLARRQPVDFVPLPLLLARTGAVPPVPPIVLNLSAAGFRRRQTQVLLGPGGPARATGFPPPSRCGAPC